MPPKRPMVFFRVSSQGRRYCCALLLLALAVAKGRAQTAAFWQASEEAERSLWVPRLRYINTDVEAERNTFRSSSGNAQQGLERMYVAPSFGVEWNYYIYHPYLVTYSMLLEPVYLIRFEGPPGALRRTDEFLLDGKFAANILELKPYASTLTYSRNYGEIRYDLFNSALVDAQSLGFGTGYREGPVPVTLDFQRTHEDSLGFNNSSIADQTTVNLHARNERGRDNASDFLYQYGEFDRTLKSGGSSYLTENSYHHVSASDIELFDRSTLRSSLLFYDIPSGNASSSDVNAAVAYTLELTPQLQNFDNYSLSYFSGNASGTVQNYGVVGVTHHLYDSLVSSLQLNGSTLNSSSAATSLDAVSAGVAGSIDYSKRLGDWARLTVDDIASFTFNDQQTSGELLLIPNESYTVPRDGLVRLTQPRAVSITSVTDANNNPLQPGLDYTVIQTTDPWQIRIQSFGPAHIQPGAVILVTYTVQPNPSGSYTARGNSAQVSLRFWKERINLFIRYNFTDYQTSSTDFLLDNQEDLQTGAEFGWNGLFLHGDYTDHHSTFYSFHGYNLVEDYSMNLSSDSTLGVDLTQQWLTYANGGAGASNLPQNTTFYNFALHYEWHPTTRLSVNTEAGYRLQHGFGFDENLIAVRAYLNWNIGKSEVHLGYEHQKQNLTGEQNIRDFAFLRLRRYF